MKIEPIFKTTLAEDMSPGPQGQPAHKKGSEVNIASMIETKKLGRFIMVTPNPIFFYLNSAEKKIEDINRLLKKIDSTNKQVIFSGSSEGQVDAFRDLEDALLYEFYEKAIEVPILLFTSIEAFTNQLIPAKYQYDKTNKWLFWKRANLNKADVEKKISTDEKLTKILFVLKGKQIKDSHLWSKYKQIKRIRDEVVHLKTREKSSVVAYNELYRDLIDINFSELFSTTKEIIRFYIPGYFKQ